VSTLKTRPGEINIVQICAAEVDIHHIGPAKVGASQIRLAQRRAPEIRLPQVGLLQVSV
jgi:hypothetical protein